MTISSLAERARVLVAGLLVFLMLGITGHAMADEPGEPPRKAPGSARAAAANTAKGMAAAPQLIIDSKVGCDLNTANFIGETNVKKDGKTIKGETYELSCKNGPGWMLTRASDGTIDLPYNCTQAFTYHEKNPGIILCALPENQPHYAWLNAVMEPYVPGCDVTNARLIGSTTGEDKIDRYEVACKTAAGGVVDVPAPGSTAATSEFRSCLMVTGSSACQYTTAEKAREALMPAAKAASATCEVNNVRFIAPNSENTNLYYEIGCANEPGYVVVTDLKNTYQRLISCSNAGPLGGCQYTTADAAASDQNQDYSNKLKAAGYACTVEEANVMGTQPSTNRDYVEVRCRENQFGLIGLVPQPGSDANVYVRDCFLDQVYKKDCTLTTTETLTAHLDKLIKIAEPNKGCDVKEVRYIAESDTENGVIAELACGNKRGYLVELAPNRQSLTTVISCNSARENRDELQCEIPGNGTYQAPSGT